MEALVFSVAIALTVSVSAPGAEAKSAGVIASFRNLSTLIARPGRSIHYALLRFPFDRPVLVVLLGMRHGNAYIVLKEDWWFAYSDGGYLDVYEVPQKLVGVPNFSELHESSYDKADSGIRRALRSLPSKPVGVDRFFETHPLSRWMRLDSLDFHDDLIREAQSVVHLPPGFLKRCWDFLRALAP